MAFDLAVFRLRYPELSGVTDDVVLAAADQAPCYLDLDCIDDCAVYLLTAHIVQLGQNAIKNIPAGQITSASIDKVSVTVAQAPSTNSFSYWLASTRYGQQLSALLSRAMTGVRSVGSMPERSAFRSVGGLFPNRGRAW